MLRKASNRPYLEEMSREIEIRRPELIVLNQERYMGELLDTALKPKSVMIGGEKDIITSSVAPVINPTLPQPC